MYTPEDIELYRRLGELMEVVPEWDWRVYCLGEARPFNFIWNGRVFAGGMSANSEDVVFIPPLSWLVRELEDLQAIEFYTFTGLYPSALNNYLRWEDKSKNTWVCQIRKPERIQYPENWPGPLHWFHSPTPEGACVMALIRILEERDGK